MSQKIPSNLNECFSELRRILTRRQLEEFKKNNPMFYHHGFGTWIRNNWIYGPGRNGSKLAQYFNDLGIFHPDDMSCIILTSFWRHLHKMPIRLERQTEMYKQWWEHTKRNPPYEREKVEDSLAAKILSYLTVGGVLIGIGVPSYLLTALIYGFYPFG